MTPYYADHVLTQPTAGSVCSGYGGLDLAAEQVFGARAVWFADNDPSAAAVLAHHWPNLPNLGDIRLVDWATIERVELLTGGTPCQDISAAGKRAGLLRGNRSGVWHAMVDAVEELRPLLVLWENVRGATSAKADSVVEPCPGCLGDRDNVRALRALGRVLGDLADLGYDAVWCGLPAAAVGCAHLRWRIFVAAVDTRRRNWPLTLAQWCAAAAADPGRVRGVAGRGGGPGITTSGEPFGDVAGRGCPPADADTDRNEHGRQRFQQPGGTAATRGGSGTTPGDEQYAPFDWQEYTAAVRHQELTFGRTAPMPTIIGQRGQPKLSPWFTEWLMALEQGHVTDVPGLTVNQMLRLCGNGVVIPQAAAAFRWLASRLIDTVADWTDCPDCDGCADGAA